MGVSEESKAYRLFDPLSNKIIVSRDVVFEEDQQWNWDDGHKQAILAEFEWETEEEAEVEDEGDGEESEVNEESGETEPESDGGNISNEEHLPRKI